METVVLPWSPLSRHLEHTGEHDGVVYEPRADAPCSLASELGAAAFVTPDSPALPACEAEEEAQTGPCSSALARLRDPAPLGTEPDWAATDGHRPGPPMAGIAGSAAAWTAVACFAVGVVEAAWAVVAALLLAACVAVRCTARSPPSEAERLQKSAAALEHAVAAGLAQVKRCELQRRGFRLLGSRFLPPVARMERNECLRDPARRDHLECPRLRSALRAALRRAALAYDAKAKADADVDAKAEAKADAEVVAEVDVPLLAELAEELRGLARRRALYFSSPALSPPLQRPGDAAAAAHVLASAAALVAAAAVAPSLQRLPASSAASANARSAAAALALGDVHVGIRTLHTLAARCEARLRREGRMEEALRVLDEVDAEVARLAGDVRTARERLVAAREGRAAEARASGGGEEHAAGEEPEAQEAQEPDQVEREEDEGKDEDETGASFTEVFQSDVGDVDSSKTHGGAFAFAFPSASPQAEEQAQSAWMGQGLVCELDKVLAYRQVALAPERLVRDDADKRVPSARAPEVNSPPKLAAAEAEQSPLLVAAIRARLKHMPDPTDECEGFSF